VYMPGGHFFEHWGYPTAQLTCTVFEEVVAAGLRGSLAKKISPGEILSARTASLRDWHALDHQSELAILVPNASAEKRTSEQPTGKRTYSPSLVFFVYPQIATLTKWAISRLSWGCSRAHGPEEGREDVVGAQGGLRCPE
jgi:hypothetical protein